mmetsp:Transcript_30067/g.66129  ORF Transcript_30067/g.66129 Transcript_30067/m.66129 type:complete len:264 (-) Transcript_30067:1736-2527(-)|eukprot:CAMPEP_0178560936 /NCGR_PEP_ID=MMETSP0697-20121206/11746_1 /TAXON_ID=265572 /ORGANISM="Extubocellulus spinifer, Strain CCMP396" /LENGTH=263 /DNA_ID=CAMNT_0020194213 /DNA_START=170 /DNA_END=961 /DNA_ORIENTATION=+
MAPFLAVSVLLLAAQKQSACRRLEVCLSPGCVADGALPAIAKLRALSPDTVAIEDGKCASACGAGPVVIEPSDETNTPSVVHKRIKDALLIKLLEENGDGIKIDENLISGYELFVQAEEAASRRNHGKAVEMYKQSTDLVADLVMQALEGSSTINDRDGIPDNVQWIIAAYRNLAKSKLATFDRDGALRAAQTACRISNNFDALSLEALAEVCAAMKDDAGELDALRQIFALEREDDGEQPRDVALRRREQGFRLARLEKLVG